MSNPYPDRFLRLLDRVDRPVLDCGAGGRTHPDVVALEYVEHPASSVRADGMALPFRSESFALVLSQAVVEHVTDPQAYIDEVWRVLRPGGLLYVEVAFMQPVHMPPMHFFNVTPFGLAHLCRRFEIVEQGAFGLLADWWRWVGAEAGANQVLTPQERAAVLAAMGKLDEAITPTRLANVASAVCLLGRKPADRSGHAGSG